MLPTVRDIIKVRLHVMGMVRVLALAVVCFGLLTLLGWIEEGIADSDLWSSYYHGVIARGVVTIGLGVGLFLFAAPISRLMVPFYPDVRCPWCGYIVAGLRAGRCPECALPVPEELTGGDDVSCTEAFRHRAARMALVERAAKWSGILFIAVAGSLMAFAVLEAVLQLAPKGSLLRGVGRAVLLIIPGSLALAVSAKFKRDRRVLRAALGDAVRP